MSRRSLADQYEEAIFNEMLTLHDMAAAMKAVNEKYPGLHEKALNTVLTSEDRALLARAAARHRDRVQVPSPADQIKAELEKRGWDVHTLSIKAGIREFILKQIVDGDRMIGQNVAMKIATAFGHNPTDWINNRRAYFNALTTAKLS